ncbi:MAG: ATP-binding protein [Hyphomicrobiales bacterium]
MAAESKLSDAENEHIAPFKRLADLRWVVVVATVGMFAFWLRGDIGLGAALLFMLAICAAIMVEPATSQRRRRLKALQVARNVAQQAVWPDTSTKRVIASLSSPSVLIDREGIVRFLNDAARAVFSDIRPGQPMSLHLRQRNLVAALGRVAETIEAEQLEYIERVPVERWFNVAISPLGFGSHAKGVADKDKASSPFLLIQFHDLSEQKRTERMRVDFIANASHELRTPLASMSGFIETLLGPAKNDETARVRFLKIMRDQSERMSRLIDDLLSLSRIEMKAHLKPTDTVELVQLVNHVADTLTPLAKDNDVSLSLEIEDGGYVVHGAEDELVQVFSNLVENAIKYGATGKKVEIELVSASSRGGPGITVRDFGPGIASEHVPRLTERFYRADMETSKSKQGTGLGLAIVKHILNRHNAQLEIKTQSGAGAAFTVRFPRIVTNGGVEKPDLEGESL